MNNFRSHEKKVINFVNNLLITKSLMLHLRDLYLPIGNFKHF